MPLHKTLLLLICLLNLFSRGARADDELGVIGSYLESAAVSDARLLTSVAFRRSNMPALTLVWSKDTDGKPILQGRIRGSYEADHMAIQNLRAFLVKGRELKIYDLAQPGKPRLLQQTSLDFEPIAIKTLPDQIWLCGRSELRLLEFVNGKGLKEWDRIPTQQNIVGIHQDGAQVYLELQNKDLMKIVSTTDRRNAALELVYPLEDGASIVSIEKNFAYLDSGRELTVINLASAQPQIVKRMNTDGAWVAAVQQRKAYLVRGTLKVLDLDDAAPSVMLSDADIDLGFERVQQAIPWGKTIVVGTRGSGLRFYDLEKLSDSQSNRLLTWNDLDYSIDLIAAHGLVYVANGHAGVAIFDARSHPMKLLSTVETPGFAVDLALNDNILWVADEFFGILAIDVKDPRQPRTLSRHRLPHGAYGLAVQGQRLYVAAGQEGLQVFDSSATGEVRWVTAWGRWVNRVVMRDDGRIYASTSWQDVAILRPGKGPNLTEIQTHSFALMGMPLGFDLDQDTVYIAGWKDGFALIQNDDSWHPLPWEAFTNARWGYHIRDLVAYDHKLYLTTGSQELFIADPEAALRPYDDPAEVEWYVGSVNLQGPTYALTRDGDQLFVVTDQKIVMLKLDKNEEPAVQSTLVLPRRGPL